MGAIETLSTALGSEREAVHDSAGGIHLAVLSTLGVDLRETAILDFGCGAGRTVRALRARGYLNACGYDEGDGRTLAGADRDHMKIGTGLNLRLPYEDNTFDLVISDQVFNHVQDQVRAFEELLRITKPGGHGLHIIPAQYAPIEGHVLVPFGGVFQHRLWYKLWASLGIRNRFQAGLSADETADHNAFFVSEATRYISTSLLSGDLQGGRVPVSLRRGVLRQPRPSINACDRKTWQSSDAALPHLIAPESSGCANQTRRGEPSVRERGDAKVDAIGDLVAETVRRVMAGHWVSGPQTLQRGPMARRIRLKHR